MNNLDRRKKYRQHRANAKRRVIPWEITYMQWCRIWLESGHWNERGNKKGQQYVMARFGDKGPYALWNVKIITAGENISEGNLGNQHALGHKLTAEHRAKIYAAQMGNTNMLGKKRSAETRAKISAALRGRKFSAETRAKMSAAQMGNQNHLGKKYSTETRVLMER